MKSSKLRKKIWRTSSIVLLAYTIILIAKPTIWLALLPIIIPTSILTLAPIAYSITKLIKNTLEDTTSNNIIDNTNEEKNSYQEKTNQKEIRKNNQITTNQIISYEETTIKEKNKVKTKGTIH